MSHDTRLSGRKRARRWLPRAALLVVLALGVATASGCYSVQRADDGTVTLTPVKELKPAEKPKPKVTKASTTSPEKHADKDTPAPVGTTFVTGKWDVSVSSAKEHKKLPSGHKAKKGKRFLIVDVVVRNMGASDPLIVKASQFTLYDSAGKKVKKHKTRLVAFNAKQVKPISSHMGGSTAFVYEIPKGSTGYVFAFKRSKTAKTTYRWAVP